MSKLNVLDWIAIILTVIGGINWGLVGVFGSDGDVVAAIFGGMETIGAKVIYVVVGIAALYLIYTASKMAGGESAGAAGGGMDR